MAQRMAYLSGMVPSQDEHHMAQLEGAIASALQHLAQYKALGMDTSAYYIAYTQIIPIDFICYLSTVASSH